MNLRQRTYNNSCWRTWTWKRGLFKHGDYQLLCRLVVYSLQIPWRHYTVSSPAYQIYPDWKKHLTTLNICIRCKQLHLRYTLHDKSQYFSLYKPWEGPIRHYAVKNDHGLPFVESVEIVPCSAQLANVLSEQVATMSVTTVSMQHAKWAYVYLWPWSDPF